MPKACLWLLADDTALDVNNLNTDTLITDVKHKLKIGHEWCPNSLLFMTRKWIWFVSKKNKPFPQNFTDIVTEVMTIHSFFSAKNLGVVLDAKRVGTSMLNQFVHTLVHLIESIPGCQLKLADKYTMHLSCNMESKSMDVVHNQIYLRYKLCKINS